MLVSLMEKHGSGSPPVEYNKNYNGPLTQGLSDRRDLVKKKH